MSLELLADYVVSLRRKGCILSPREYEVLREWLHEGFDADEILLELSEVLSKFYTDPGAEDVSLQRIRKQVDKRLEARRLR